MVWIWWLIILNMGLEIQTKVPTKLGRHFEMPTKFGRIIGLDLLSRY